MWRQEIPEDDDDNERMMFSFLLPISCSFAGRGCAPVTMSLTTTKGQLGDTLFEGSNGDKQLYDQRGRKKLRRYCHSRPCDEKRVWVIRNPSLRVFCVTIRKNDIRHSLPRCLSLSRGPPLSEWIHSSSNIVTQHRVGGTDRNGFIINFYFPSSWDVDSDEGMLRFVVVNDR